MVILHQGLPHITSDPSSISESPWDGNSADHLTQTILCFNPSTLTFFVCRYSSVACKRPTSAILFRTLNLFKLCLLKMASTMLLRNPTNSLLFEAPCIAAELAVVCRPSP